MASDSDPMPGDKGPRPLGAPTEEELAWVAAHLPELRQRVAGNEILYRFLGIWLAVGLIANVLSYVWASSTPDTLFALVASLLGNLGTALWTGVAVVALIQIVPEVLQRGAIRQLDAYAAAIEHRRGRERVD